MEVSPHLCQGMVENNSLSMSMKALDEKQMHAKCRNYLACGASGNVFDCLDGMANSFR